MSTKLKNIIQTVIFALFLFGLAAFCWFKPSSDFSDVERRNLAQMPPVTLESIRSGEFMTAFEDYTLDQFPLRDDLRKIKAFTALNIFRHMDYNKYYVVNGSVSKMDPVLNTEDIANATKKFRFLYNRFIKDKNANVYISVIPDKNASMADMTGHLSMDYEALYAQVKKETGDFADYIDISTLLDINDYYNTDTHWRQEQIVDIASKLANEMGTSIPKDGYKVNELANPFKGVHFYQSALQLEPDTIRYLTSPTIDALQLHDRQNDKHLGVYNMDKANGKDPYEMFSSGNLSLVTITNPNATTDKKLVVFRDSFGSSIAPLLAQGYSEITLVDIRYMVSLFVGTHVDFENTDVLFLYSSLVLNESKDTFK